MAELTLAKGFRKLRRARNVGACKPLSAPMGRVEAIAITASTCGARRSQDKRTSPVYFAIAGRVWRCANQTGAPQNGRTWILRATIGGRRRDMGLGGYPDVTLAGAREAERIAL